MVYLPRSQINVPRDRHLGNSSHLNVCSLMVYALLNLRRSILNDSKTAENKLPEDGRWSVLFVFVRPGVQENFNLPTAW